MQFFGNGVTCETSLTRFWTIYIVVANKIYYATFGKRTAFVLRWSGKLKKL